MFPPRKSHRRETGALETSASCLCIKEVAAKRNRALVAGLTLRKIRVSCIENEKRIKVVKYSPVSTGQLKRLLALHNQPINLVVFQGALGPKSNET